MAMIQSLDLFLLGLQGGLALFPVIRAIIAKEKLLIPLVPLFVLYAGIAVIPVIFPLGRSMAMSVPGFYLIIAQLPLFCWFLYALFPSLKNKFPVKVLLGLLLCAMAAAGVSYAGGSPFLASLFLVIGAALMAAAAGATLIPLPASGVRAGVSLVAATMIHMLFVLTAAFPEIPVLPGAVTVLPVLSALLLIVSCEQGIAASVAPLPVDRFREVFERAVEGIFLADEDGRVLMANPALARIMGFGSAEEITREVTRPAYLLIPDKKERRAFMDLLKNSDTLESVKVQSRRRDGTPVILLISAHAERDQASGRLRYQGYVVDVTEGEMHAETLLQSQSKYRGLYEGMIDGVFGVDRDGLITECNDTFASMTGYDRDHLLSMSLLDLVPEKWRDRLVDAAAGVSGELEILRRDGTVFTAELRTGRYGSIVRDITERKRLDTMYRRYEAIVNTSLDLMAFIDRDYRCEAINDAFCLSLGKGREEIIGIPVNEVVGDDFFQREIQPFVDTCFTGYAIYHQGRFLFEKTGERFMDVGFYPYHTGDDITHTIMIAHDITELYRTEMQLQKAKTDLEARVAARTRELQETNSILASEIIIREQAEQELRINEEKYRQLVENMTDGLFILRKDATISYVNSRMAEMLGYDEGEMLGRQVYDLLNRANRIKMKEEMAKRRAGIKRPYEIQWQKKNGRKVQTSVSPQVLYDDRGDFAGSFAVVVDITGLKTAEAELKKAKEQAESANRAKSLFLANISHEIRTPMNAILGFAELLDAQIGDATQREYLAAITNGGRMLLGLINDILDLSRIEAGKFALEYVPINLRAIVREMEGIFSRALQVKKLHFITVIDPSVPGYVNCDGIRIRQVLFNLIGNAVKFTPQGHLRVKISAKRPKRDAAVVDINILVEDTGIGIPRDQRDIIFEPFRQQEGQSPSRYGGSGLGLTITKRLVEAMGGDIAVTSTVGRGSTFIVTLKQVEIVGQEGEIDRAGAVDVGSVCIHNRKILVVDDVESNRLLLKAYLQRAGATVLEADSGEEALKIAREQRPDLVLMDIVMPGLGGDEAIGIMKHDPALSAIPVIAITASALPDRGDALKDRCQGFLFKPVSRKVLFDALGVFFPGAAIGDVDGGKAGKEAKTFTCPEELDRELQGPLHDRWQRIKDRIVFDEVGDFAGTVLSLGEKYEVAPLVEWARALQRAVANFDMERVPELLDRYGGLMDRKESADKMDGMA